MKAVLAQQAPAVAIIDLFADLPAFDAMAAGYLLAAYAPEFPVGSVFLCVVDPGVGSERAPLILQADGRWYVGPDNGILAIIARRARSARCWEITWRPERLSASFHGRDLFAPTAAGLARGEMPSGTVRSVQSLHGCGWPHDLARIVYIDCFGNAMTGLRAASLMPEATLEASGRLLRRARTFSAVSPGEAFWYENANGLAEIAVNLGCAADTLGLTVGMPVRVLDPETG
jgi:S-adenosylmethionine hydrolase